uniref:Homeobox domain-containing protein n=1 Tax=Oryza rufipogon TaxID=4529 RepID=A0A0E0PRM3_ORYRU
MEPMGILKCPSSLKLSVAVPGHALNPFSDGGSGSGSGSGSGCNNNNTRELGIHLDLDRPYAREELPQQGGSMEVQKGEERGGVRHNSSNHRRLSRVQSKQLDEFYRVNHTVDSTSHLRSRKLMEHFQKQKKELADRLNLRISQVDAWFRNRRLSHYYVGLTFLLPHMSVSVEDVNPMIPQYKSVSSVEQVQSSSSAPVTVMLLLVIPFRLIFTNLQSKQKSTEMECAYLKECFNKLKEENHRLQLQVEQLRSTSLQLQLQLQLHSERVATAPTGQQAGTSAAARIFTLPLSGYNPSRGTWFSPNAH